MCLIAFSYKSHPKYDLVFAANRDEFYQRPTRAAQFWDEHPHVLAGKDLKAGGTWMGVTKNGNLAALTNFRDPSIQKDNPPSRGHLVLDYLVKEPSPELYMEDIIPKADKYNGFNLLAGNINQLAYYSNQKESFEILESGIYGLSNHLLDTPWPKLERAKTEMKEINAQTAIDKEHLFRLLADEHKANEQELPDTGIPKEIEKAVSSIFIKTENYGSLCSTILLVDKEGNIDFTERRFEPGTKKITGEQHFQISA